MTNDDALSDRIALRQLCDDRTYATLLKEKEEETRYKKEGFWATRDPAVDIRDISPDRNNIMPGCIEYGWPVETGRFVSDEILLWLSEAEGKAKCVQFFGGSICRICKLFNGGSQFYLDDWTWPSGYRHYLTEHTVQPSDAFRAFLCLTHSNTYRPHV
jgi:hypothetical protein